MAVTNSYLVGELAAHGHKVHDIPIEDYNNRHEGVIPLKLFKGSVIGDACHCVGARMAKALIPGAIEVAIGAVTGIAHMGDRMLRFNTNHIGRRQDAGENLVGKTMIIRPFRNSQRLGKRSKPTKNPGSVPQRSNKPSQASIMRRAKVTIQ